jgi:pentalenene oxygenase
VINHPALIRQMLVDQAHAFAKGRQHEKLRPWFGNGLALSEGSLHLRQRRLMQPAFHRQQVARYVHVMQEAAEARIGSWLAGRPIQGDKELFALLVTMVTQNLFSARIDEQSVRKIQQALPVILGGVGWRTLDPTDLLEKLPTRSNRRFNEALRTVHSVVDDLIENHKPDGKDLLSMLSEADDPETGRMSRQQIHDETINILMVGTETPSTGLRWACHLLSVHQDIQASVQAEVDDVLSGRPARAEDLGKLELTRRVITEALRMYPPTWILTRRTTTDVDLGRYRIPAGAHVCYSAYALHRDPAVYRDPDCFDPDRWLPERADSIPRTAYLAFGTGNRGCIGEPIAMAQAVVTLSTLARHWTLTPAPGADVKPAAKILLMPSQLQLVPQPRRAASSTPR